MQIPTWDYSKPNPDAFNPWNRALSRALDNYSKITKASYLPTQIEADINAKTFSPYAQILSNPMGMYTFPELQKRIAANLMGRIPGSQGGMGGAAQGEINQLGETNETGGGIPYGSLPPSGETEAKSKKSIAGKNDAYAAVDNLVSEIMKLKKDKSLTGALQQQALSFEGSGLPWLDTAATLAVPKDLRNAQGALEDALVDNGYASRDIAHNYVQKAFSQDIDGLIKSIKDIKKNVIDRKAKVGQQVLQKGINIASPAQNQSRGSHIMYRQGKKYNIPWNMVDEALREGFNHGPE